MHRREHRGGCLFRGRFDACDGLLERDRLGLPRELVLLGSHRDRRNFGGGAVGLGNRPVEGRHELVQESRRLRLVLFQPIALLFVPRLGYELLRRGPRLTGLISFLDLLRCSVERLEARLDRRHRDVRFLIGDPFACIRCNGPDVLVAAGINCAVSRRNVECWRVLMLLAPEQPAEHAATLFLAQLQPRHRCSSVEDPRQRVLVRGVLRPGAVTGGDGESGVMLRGRGVLTVFDVFRERWARFPREPVRFGTGGEVIDGVRGDIRVGTGGAGCGGLGKLPVERFEEFLGDLPVLIIGGAFLRPVAHRGQPFAHSRSLVLIAIGLRTTVDPEEFVPAGGGGFRVALLLGRLRIGSSAQNDGWWCRRQMDFRCRIHIRGSPALGLEARPRLVVMPGAQRNGRRLWRYLGLLLVVLQREVRVVAVLRALCPAPHALQHVALAVCLGLGPGAGGLLIRLAPACGAEAPVEPLLGGVMRARAQLQHVIGAWPRLASVAFVGREPVRGFPHGPGAHPGQEVFVGLVRDFCIRGQWRLESRRQRLLGRLFIVADRQCLVGLAIGQSATRQGLADPTFLFSFGSRCAFG